MESVPQFAELLRATAAELAAELREFGVQRISGRAR